MIFLKKSTRFRDNNCKQKSELFQSMVQMSTVSLIVNYNSRCKLKLMCRFHGYRPVFNQLLKSSPNRSS